jgi:hypothetical protein
MSESVILFIASLFAEAIKAVPPLLHGKVA